MKLYIDGVDYEGNTICVMETMVTCDDCVFFKRLSDDRLQLPYVCMNPSGLVHPAPDGFCFYSVPKSKVVAESI